MSVALAIWVTVATLGVITGLMHLRLGYTDDDAVFGARLIIGGLFAPLAVPALLVYGAYRLVKGFPEIVRLALGRVAP